MVSSIRGLVEVGRWVRRRSGRVRDYPDSGSDRDACAHSGSDSASCLRGCSQQRGNPGLPVLQPLAVRADSVEGGRGQQRMHRCWAVEGRRRGDAVYLRSRLVCPVDGVQQVAGRSAAGERIVAALVRCNPAWASQPGETAVDSIPSAILDPGSIPSAWWPWSRSRLDPVGVVALEPIPSACRPWSRSARRVGPGLDPGGRGGPGLDLVALEPIPARSRRRGGPGADPVGVERI